MTKYSFEDLVEFAVLRLEELKRTAAEKESTSAESAQEISHQAIKRSYFDQAFDLAKEEQWAFDLLAEESARAIERGEVHDERLRDWASKMVRGEHARPPGPRGPKRSADRVQIAILVQELSRLPDLRATRNDESESISACDIAAQAAMRSGIKPSSYKTVKEAYFEFKPLLDAAGKHGKLEFDLRGRNMKIIFTPMSTD